MLVDLVYAGSAFPSGCSSPVVAVLAIAVVLSRGASGTRKPVPRDKSPDSSRAGPRCLPLRPDFVGPTRAVERETGIEPATNSLEGCDSTPELLPLSLRRSEFPSVVVEVDGFEPP